MAEPRRLIELRDKLTHLLDLPEGPLVVALSGGADSAALAYLLSSHDRAPLAIHVAHGLPGSGALEVAARAIADRLGLPLEVVAIDVPGGSSFEGRAREARYEALRSRLQPGQWLLTAHTLDDQAETVLMNMLRGAGPSGLAGIPVRSGSLVRPMLGVTRSETRELASLAGLPYRDDPANLDPGFRRNVVRREVLPHLSARFNPRLIESLARTAATVAAEGEALQAEALSVSVLERAGEVAVAIGDLLAVSRPVADRVLRRCLAAIRPPYSGSSAELGRIWEVVTGEQAKTLLEGLVEVRVVGPLLVFGGGGEAASQHRADLEVGENRIDGFILAVERAEGICRVAPVGTWAALFDPEARLVARVDASGRLLVEADGETAWIPGRRRYGVAWYQPGTNGYLSVFAREESGWTSSP